MKTLSKISAVAALATLTSCNFTDPVQYNDNLVNKMDSVIAYQSDFIDKLGKQGDTATAAYDNLNKYIDTSITNINNLPEYSTGTEFKNSVVQILNNLKTSSVSNGKELMTFYDRMMKGEMETEAEYQAVEEKAGIFDKTWEDEMRKFDEAQKKYAEKAGITIEKVGKIVK